jgi:2-(1,2-epoxy-1,2-dihydrophenyl)acetyl-CoA isomerase
MTDHLKEEIQGGVAILTMNRPDRRNAMSNEMLIAMLESLSRLAADDDIGCVVLTGAGGAFCAGGDVKAMADGEEFDGDTLEAKTQQLRAVMETSRLLHEMPKPTIAMVGGAAAGAGLSLALACDMRVAASSAKFTTAFAKVGYSGDFGGSYYLTHLVGTAKARELYYTAALVMADEALSLGMVNHVFPAEELEAETLGLAEGLAAGPRIAYRYMKRNLNAAEGGAPLKDLLDMEALHHSRCGMTEDHQEAARAFVEKRPPVFKGC